jgi:hypothetical protein
VFLILLFILTLIQAHNDQASEHVSQRLFINHSFDQVSEYIFQLSSIGALLEHHVWINTEQASE